MSTRIVLTAAAGLVIGVALCFSNYASQVALHPLFGHTAVTQTFRFIWTPSVYAAALTPDFILDKPQLIPLCLTLLSLVWSAAPVYLLKAGGYFGRIVKDPTKGSVPSQLPAAIPANILCAMVIQALAHRLQDQIQLGPVGSKFYVSSVIWVVVMISGDGVIHLVYQSGYYDLLSPCNVFFALGGTTAVIAALWSLFGPRTVPAKKEEPAPAPAAPATPAKKSSKKAAKQEPEPPKKEVVTAPPAKRSPFVAVLPVAITAALLATTRSQRPCSTPEYPYVAGVNNTIRILASQQSLTGRLVVAENLDRNFRYLRCDHSMLGGVWIGDEMTVGMNDGGSLIGSIPGGGFDKKAQRLGDTVYPAFVVQEGVRLFERDKGPEEPPIEGNEGLQEKESALIIGLGIGTATRALNIHGVSTTILEIDPAIPELAREFFNLQEQFDHQADPFTALYTSPQVPKTFAVDAREWVSQRAGILSGMRPIRENMRYDYIIHDCFSGGTVPEHLYTVQFWEQVKTVMKLNGVLAVNYAGRINSDGARAFLTTLEHSFGKCRVFHDRISNDGTLPQPDAGEFINLIFFCTQSPTNQMNLRPAEDDDNLGSYLRDYVFKTFPIREVPREAILAGMEEKKEDAYLLRDERNLLRDWQQPSALHHWGVMRQVLSHEHWETY